MAENASNVVPDAFAQWFVAADHTAEVVVIDSYERSETALGVALTGHFRGNFRILGWSYWSGAGHLVPPAVSKLNQSRHDDRRLWRGCFPLVGGPMAPVPTISNC